MEREGGERKRAGRDRKRGKGKRELEEWQR